MVSALKDCVKRFDLPIESFHFIFSLRRTVIFCLRLKFLFRQLMYLELCKQITDKRNPRWNDTDICIGELRDSSSTDTDSVLSNTKEKSAPDVSSELMSPATGQDSNLSTSPPSHARSLVSDVEACAARVLVTPSGNSSYHRDFYQYVWFRLLVLLILLQNFEIFLALLFLFPPSPGYGVVKVLASIAPLVMNIVVLVPLFALFFLCLEDFKRPISRFLLRLCIGRGVQHRVGLCLPYIVLVAFLLPNISYVFID